MVRYPLEVMSLSEAVELTPDLSEQAWEQWGVDAADRPNVLVYAGEGIQGQRLVVFQDRFEKYIFHSEPGDRNFGWMFL